jgi:hypothetical protein
MLKLIINQQEHYDEVNSEFVKLNGQTIELEHSLLSLSKWESIYQIPFLGPETKTSDQVMTYIKCMILTPDVDESIFQHFTQEDLDKIDKYINSKESATTFGIMPQQKGPGEVITSELIYYWMVAFNIPFECEKWHINRLFSLVRICNIKNSKPKKMSRHEIAEQNRALNEQRKKQYNTTG